MPGDKLLDSGYLAVKLAKLQSTLAANAPPAHDLPKRIMKRAMERAKGKDETKLRRKYVKAKAKPRHRKGRVERNRKEDQFSTPRRKEPEASGRGSDGDGERGAVDARGGIHSGEE